MRHVNPGGGAKIKKLEGAEFNICWCLCLNCSKTHLQASVIPKFSGVIIQSPVKQGRGRRGRVKEEERIGGR